MAVGTPMGRTFDESSGSCANRRGRCRIMELVTSWLFTSYTALHDSLVVLFASVTREVVIGQVVWYLV